MLSYQYRKYHCGDKTVVRSSYLHKGLSYTGKIVSLYWIRTKSFLWTGEWWYMPLAYHWFMNWLANSSIPSIQSSNLSASLRPPAGKKWAGPPSFPVGQQVFLLFRVWKLSKMRFSPASSQILMYWLNIIWTSVDLIGNKANHGEIFGKTQSLLFPFKIGMNWSGNYHFPNHLSNGILQKWILGPFQCKVFSE